MEGMDVRESDREEDPGEKSLFGFEGTPKR